MKHLFIGILVCVLVLLSACSPQQQNPDETETRSLPAVEEREEEKDVLPDSKSGSSRQDVSSGEEPEDVPQGVLSYPDTQAEDSTEPAVSPKPSEAPASSPQTQITSPAVPENHGSTPSPEAAPSPVPETQPTPEPEPMPEPNPEPNPEPETPPEEPVQQPFDISVWISYAQSYGQSLGLCYDSTATACWDNPIIASSRSQYLERDIRSRLELYASDGMTYFCVWAQPRSDGGYDLYIGYA